MESKNVFPERLNELRRQTGITIDALSLGSGVSASAINAYMQDKTYPSVQALEKLADFLAVPVDYLLGRTDSEDLDRNYADFFMKLRRAPYEQYLDSGRSRISGVYIGRRTEAPWPYNLLDDIVDPYGESRWDSVLTEDQIDGMNDAIDTLGKRESDMLRDYYEHGMTLEAVASKNAVTRERVRQIVTKSVRRLRHPSRLSLIKHGKCGFAAEQDCAHRMEELRKQQEELVEMEVAVRAKMAELGTLMAIIPDGRVNYTPKGIMEASIDELDLSVRSWNCLRREQIKTIGQACDAARSGRLLKIRNLGKKSLDEILTKLLYVTGESFSDVYRGQEQ